MKHVLLGVILILIIGGIVYFIQKDTNASTVNQKDVEPLVKEEQKEKVLKPIKDGSYVVNKEKSILTWQGKKTLVADYIDEGTIDLKSGDLTMENGGLKQGNIVFDTSSIKALKTGKNAGETMLEKHLKSPDFFDTEKYPEAKFVLKEISTTEEPYNYNVLGSLTIKDITEDLSFPAMAYMNDEQLIVEANVEVNRTKWNIRYGSDKFFDNLANNVIADNFGLNFKIFLDKK